MKMREPESYAEHVLIQAAHTCFEVNIVIIHDTQEELTSMYNDSYSTTVTLGNLENYHFVRAKPIIGAPNTAYV